jgi:hypothetical protein
MRANLIKKGGGVVQIPMRYQYEVSEMAFAERYQFRNLRWRYENEKKLSEKKQSKTSTLRKIGRVLELPTSESYQK